jgi:endonuclease-3
VNEAIKKRAAMVRRELERAFPNPPIPLNHTSNYTLLVAVILSAQCTDKRVNETTKILFKQADTPEKMLKLGAKKVRAIIKPCGLPDAKTRALVEGARILIEKFGGEVPGTREELESLPGVGEKTAGVVLIHAFGAPAFPVDTHIFRLARRWGLSKGRTPSKVSADLRALYPAKSWEKLHLQFVYYGRNYCTARGCNGPKGPNCCEICAKVANIMVKRG